MIELIRKMVMGADSPKADETNTVSDADAAAAALLVEVACIDGDFDEQERQTIAALMAKQFDLDVNDVVRLIDDASTAVDRSVDHFGFVRQVNNAYDHDARIGLLEMLWEVTLADGEIHDFEANLMRRLSGLLHIPDREAGDAKKRVMARLDIQAQ